MNTGITRIEGIVTDIKTTEDKRQFTILRNGESPIEYIVPKSLKHMMEGIKTGVRIVIEETVSGPKSITTYSAVIQEEDIDTTVNLAKEEALA